jgi:hypothetical protein
MSKYPTGYFLHLFCCSQGSEVKNFRKIMSVVATCNGQTYIFRGVNSEEKTFYATRDLYHKAYYGRNLQISIIS